MLIDPQCVTEVAGSLLADDFYQPRHRHLFRAMVDLDERQAGSAEPVAVAQELTSRNQLDEVGGRDFLATILEAVPSSAFVENHARIVRELSIRRALILAAESVRKRAAEGGEPISETMDRAEREVLRVGDRLSGDDYRYLPDALNEQMQALLSSDQPHVGLQTGFHDLDDRQGFRPGDLVILAARPSMGKTAFALNIVEQVALKPEDPGICLLFSLEMPYDQLLLRFLSARSSIPHDKLRSGRLTNAQRAALSDAAADLSHARVYIDDSSQPTLSEIRAKARRLNRDGKLSLIAVDYLQLLTASGAESRQQEISVISRTLKSLARELSVPVLALAQLNRAAETRDDRRPRLADLRESGSIEQDADLVMLLFREEYYQETDDNRGKADLIVAKNRNGATGTIHFTFRPETMRFRGLLRSRDEERYSMDAPSESFAQDASS